MATITNPRYDLLDASKMLGADGRTIEAVNLMMQKNALVGDATVVPTTGVDEHKAGVITDIPFPKAVGYNDFAPVVKVSRDIITEGTTKYENWQEWNPDTLQTTLGSNGKKVYLADNSRGIIEGHAQQIAVDSIYANKAQDVKKFNGFFSRRNKLGDWVHDAGGTGNDNTSGLFVAWGKRAAYALYPRNSKSGLEMVQHKERVVDRTNADGTEERATRRDIQYMQRWGVFIHHPASVQRICNIDVSDLSGNNPAAILKYLTAIVYNTETLPAGVRKCCYFNVEVLKALRAEALKTVSTGGGLTFENYQGKRVLKFEDITIKQQTKLINTEAQVVA